MFQGEPEKFPFYVDQKVLEEWDLKLFYVPLYVKEYLTDGKVEMMTYEERGMYIHLLCHQWQEWGIPKDKVRLRSILGRLTPKKFEKVWSILGNCFEEKTKKNSVTVRGRVDQIPLLVNKTLEKKRSKVITEILNRKKVASSGGKGRAKKFKNNGRSKEKLGSNKKQKNRINVDSSNNNEEISVLQHSSSTTGAQPEHSSRSAIQSQTQTQTQSQINKSPLPNPKGGITQNDFSQGGNGFGGGPFKKPLNVPADIRKKVSQIVNKHKKAFDKSCSRNGSEVKGLMKELMGVSLINNYPNHLLGLILQARDAARDPIAYLVNNLTKKSYSPPDGTIQEVKKILSQWRDEDHVPGPIDDLVKNLFSTVED